MNNATSPANLKSVHESSNQPANQTSIQSDNQPSIQLGLDTFGDTTSDLAGNTLHHAQVIRNVVAQGQLADQVGVDFFGIGEHHRPDFAVSAPDTILAALAATTERVRLGSAVTVLSSDDPIRVYQRFATINAISNGRAEVVLGRGSFTESFPLFGYKLEDYNELFAEKFSLFKRIVSQEPVNWAPAEHSPVSRTPLVNKEIYPKTEGTLQQWLAVGGSPESVVRAVQTQTPLMLAIIGGAPERFQPFVDLYRKGTAEVGAPTMPLAIHSPGHVADTDEEAKRQLRTHWLLNRNKIGRERGWGPAGEQEFDREVEQGSLYVGSPETVAQKIAHTIKTLGADRFDMKYSHGALPHEYSMRSIELYGTQVMPRVRELLAE